MVFLNKVEFMVVGILIKHFLKNRRKLSYFNIERFREFPSRKGSHQKKVKKFYNKCELWGGGGQQILVCEPQKSAFLEIIFQKTC